MKSIKSLLAMLLTMAMLVGCMGAVSAAPSPEIQAVPLTADGMEVLRSWILTPGFSGENEINYFEIDENAVFGVYDVESEAFFESELTEEAIYGNFVALFDADGNETADLILMVNFEDADTVWDPEMFWIDGAGEAEPGTDDETGIAVFGAKSSVPWGERLLTGIGFGDWSAPVDFQNYENSPYWSDNDYYNATSSDTLTILSGYRTSLQPTGWTCGTSSMVTVLDWYGLRNNLNAYDIANLRGMDHFGGATPLTGFENALKHLNNMGLIGDYEYEYSPDNEYALYDPAWVTAHLQAGHPIMVMWNSFGWHWQTIIGYDNMGTEGTNDDVLIMMDPYDTTDHNANGYELESYERLIYGVCYDPELGATGTQYFVFWPTDFEYEPVMGDGIPANPANVGGSFDDSNKMGYGNTAADIDAYYPDTQWRGDNGLAGPATGGYERARDHEASPYWMNPDFYNMESTDTLHILSGFQTIQQATEWTCGLASALMVMNRFDMTEGESDVSLATHRQGGKAGATTLAGMEEVFTYMNETYGHDWVWVTTNDLDDPMGEESYIGDYCLQAGTDEYWYGLIPYLLDNGIPIMIGSDEWGGHWQVIIGYDDMGTVDRTEDDVIILADPYDSTDHNHNGYLIDGFERLVYGWYSSFEPELKHNDFIAAFPASVCPNVVEELGIA